MCVPETHHLNLYVLFALMVIYTIGGVGRDWLLRYTSPNFQVLIVNNRQYVALLLFSCLVKQQDEFKVNCSW